MRVVLATGDGTECSGVAMTAIAPGEPKKKVNAQRGSA
jgi:hypothetical protein